MEHNQCLVKWNEFANGNPIKTEEYLVCDANKPEVGVSTMTYDAENKQWLFEAGLPYPIPMTIGKDLTLTHWMELPPIAQIAPSESGNKQL